MKYKIHLSGFSQQEKNTYSKEIKDLEGSFHPNMLTYTNILLCKSVLCTKYKIAQILKCKILHISWLKESTKEKKFLPLEQFRLKIFQGIKVGILGFGCEDFNELVKNFKNLFSI